MSFFPKIINSNELVLNLKRFDRHKYTIMDIQKFTLKSQEALSQAQSIASSNGNQSIETGHLLKALFVNDKEVIPFLLGKLHVNQHILEQAWDRILQTYSKVEGGPEPNNAKCSK
jgi:ATP-dependent Clp protease ATP-binding subunit ClpB